MTRSTLPPSLLKSSPTADLATSRSCRIVAHQDLVESGVTVFESEESMRRGDEALNSMSPGGSERRTSVEFYEVPVHTLS